MISRIIWPFAKRFVGGRDIREVSEKSRALKKLGYKIIFSSSGEHIEHSDIASILKIKNEYIELIGHLEKSDKVAIKLSQFGLAKARSISEKWEATAHLLEILKLAREKKVQVPFDAEYLTDREFYTDFLASLWNAGYINIEKVVQAYGPSEDWKYFIAKCASIPMPVRVCMGAYKSDLAALSFKKDYAKIDRQYNYAVNEFLSRGIEIEIATGNEERINHWLGKTWDQQTARFSMLLGVRPDLARNLKNIGRAPYLYLLFGDSWFPYFRRRVLENPRHLLLPFQRQHEY